ELVQRIASTVSDVIVCGRSWGVHDQDEAEISRSRHVGEPAKQIVGSDRDLAAGLLNFIHVDVRLDALSARFSEEALLDRLYEWRCRQLLAIEKVSRDGKTSDSVRPSSVIRSRRGLPDAISGEIEHHEALCVSACHTSKRFQEVIVNQNDDHDVGPIREHLVFEDVDVLSQRAAIDTEPEDFGVIRSKSVFQNFREAPIPWNLEGGDVAVADHGDSPASRISVPHVDGMSGVVSLGIDPKHGVHVVSDAPSSGLVWPILQNLAVERH